VRGGMCWGDLFIQDDVMFGPALVTGHLLGEKLAIYPRIVVDPEIMDLQASRAKFKDSRLFKEYVKRGDDGVYFINYLRHLYTAIGNPHDPKSQWEYDMSGLRAHAEFINEKLTEYSEKTERIKQKAIWLGLYHNSYLEDVMRELPDLKRTIGSTTHFRRQTQMPTKQKS
jgi:hypothetical protein